MHNLKLWSSSNNINNINRFKESLKNKFKFESYTDLHKWSVKKKGEFWKEIWKFTKIIGDLKGSIFTHNNDFVKCIFFEDSKLNYSENCLSKNDDTDAIVFY